MMMMMGRKRRDGGDEDDDNDGGDDNIDAGDTVNDGGESSSSRTRRIKKERKLSEKRREEGEGENRHKKGNGRGDVMARSTSGGEGGGGDSCCGGADGEGEGGEKDEVTRSMRTVCEKIAKDKASEKVLFDYYARGSMFAFNVRPQWLIQCKEKKHECRVNDMERWAPELADTFFVSMNKPDVCDFEFILVKGTSAGGDDDDDDDNSNVKEVARIRAASVILMGPRKSEMIEMQWSTEGFDTSKKKQMRLYESECHDANILKTVLFYMHTGFLAEITAECKDVGYITAEALEKPNFSFDMIHVYRLARFLQIPSLVEKILTHCIKIIGPETLFNDARRHRACMLRLCDDENDDTLFESVTNALATYDFPTISMTGHIFSFSPACWEAIVRKSGDLCLFNPWMLFCYHMRTGMDMEKFKNDVLSYNPLFRDRARKSGDGTSSSSICNGIGWIGALEKESKEAAQQQCNGAAKGMVSRITRHMPQGYHDILFGMFNGSPPSAKMLRSFDTGHIRHNRYAKGIVCAIAHLSTYLLSYVIKEYPLALGSIPWLDDFVDSMLNNEEIYCIPDGIREKLRRDTQEDALGICFAEMSSAMNVVWGVGDAWEEDSVKVIIAMISAYRMVWAMQRKGISCKGDRRRS